MDTPAKIGKYEIQGILGKGGMGVVYRAFDPAIQRSVAIKTIDKSALAAADLQYALTRFRHEAQAVGRLEPFRASRQIYDYSEDVKLGYIVMELVHGKSMYSTWRNNEQFGLRETRRDHTPDTRRHGLRPCAKT